MNKISLTIICKISRRLLLVLVFAATLVPTWKAQAHAAPLPSSLILHGIGSKTLRDGRSESNAAINTREVLAGSQPIKVYLPSVYGSYRSSGIKPGYFALLPPGSKLPSDAECAAAVKRKPENKRINLSYNATTGKGQKLADDFFGSGVDQRANTVIAARVTGNFTGTTDEILQWAACKWGMDEDMVRAQAAIESWWEQDVMGDWTNDASRCSPGHELGKDGRQGQCPESWGILQNRYPYEQSAWPGIYVSTAFNADTAYAEMRSCYEGYEWWLNNVDRGSQYAAGDAWGCVGRWFAGRWHTGDAEGYAGRVKDYLKQRIWETPSFQDP